LDAQDHVISENFYWRTSRIIPPPAPATSPATTRANRRRPPPGPQEDFTDLRSLPEVSLDVAVSRRDDGGKCFLTATVTNRGTAAALLAHLQLRRAGAPAGGNVSDAAARVLPVS